MESHMALEIRKSSNWWYGVFMVNGRKTIINLGVPITGKRPPKRTMLGDDEFERSRGRAQEAYDAQQRKMLEDRTGEKALTKLAEMKTGRQVSSPSWRSCPDCGRGSRGGRLRTSSTRASAGCASSGSPRSSPRPSRASRSSWK